MSLDTPATISAGHWHSLVTTECGALFAGCSDHGRLGVAPKNRTASSHARGGGRSSVQVRDRRRRAASIASAYARWSRLQLGKGDTVSSATEHDNK